MALGESPYQMTISLEVLKHLGVGLYSNVPAVLSETVANAWDADATRVEINVADDTITIQDNGHGMSIDDANKKYLLVGYRRRKDHNGGERTPKLNRQVMGRKGIGKLSLFSIAKTVTVYSTKDSHRHGFRMNADSIEESIRGNNERYRPEPLDAKDIILDIGTKIILSDLKRRSYKSAHLRKRLARRFSVIGDMDGFEVILDGEPITAKDRADHENLQYIWTFGEAGEAMAARAPGAKACKRPSDVRDGEPAECIDGWIGTVYKAGQAQDKDLKDNLNAIPIMVRGKMAQEDILEEFGEGGVYSTYVMGEIHADFLDVGDKDDTATTSRQHIIEDDPRYDRLREKIKKELKHIQSKWTELRNEDGPKEALVIPAIRKWYGGLSSNHRTMAEKLFGRINQYAIDDDQTKRRLFVGAIVTFETLKFRNLLDLLEGVKTDNLEALGSVFKQLDEIEANAYYQITRDRLGVINKLGTLVDNNAREKVIQKHLFDHLWLLDPSWERATYTEQMEKSVKKAFDDVDAPLQRIRKDQGWT